MLRDHEGRSFATGSAVFMDTDLAEVSPKIYVRIQPGNLLTPVLAQLDTGAAWSVLNAEVARLIGVLDARGEPLTLSTRMGNFRGKLVRVSVSLVADARESLNLDATFFVSSNGPTPHSLDIPACSSGSDLPSTLNATCSTSDTVTVPRDEVLALTRRRPAGFLGGEPKRIMICGCYGRKECRLRA